MDSIDQLDDDIPATQIVDDRVLKNVVAYVEVRAPHDNRSEGVRKKLEQLGANVVKKYTKDVTHVVFRGGSNRTKTKALKSGVHFVSALWVENCLQNQEHVSERMYPAVVPGNSTPLLLTRLKKTKSMQPLDFEVELANSAERVRRKRKRDESLQSRLFSTDRTPTSSPLVLVQETQPRSPGEGFICTPVRLTIPDTPPSMREKLEQLRRARQESSINTEGEEAELEAEANRQCLDQFKKTLFNSSDLEESPIHKLDNSAVFTPNINNTIETDSQADVSGHDSQSQDVNKDILSIVDNITATLSKVGDKFDSESDVNLLSSQEIGKIVQDNKILKDKVCVTPPVKRLTFKESSSVEASGESTVCTSRKSSRRSSRRLSIKEVVQDLAESNVTSQTNYMNLGDEDENPLPDILEGSESPNIVGTNEKVDKLVSDCAKQNSTTKTRRRSVLIKNADSREDVQKSKVKSNRRKSAFGRLICEGNDVDSVNKETKGTTDNATEDTAGECQVSAEDNPEDCAGDKKGKRKLKRKLLSLTDLEEPNSILMEPTVCSSTDRPQLINEKPKRGRKKAGTQSQTSKDGSNAGKCEKDAPISKKHKTDVKRKNAKVNNDDDKETSPKDGENSKKSRKQSVKAPLAEDTLLEQTNKTDLSLQHCRNVSAISKDISQTGELSTQLDLTRDSSLLSSVRETSMSLSMSTAYTDSSMPSFLMSNRRSVDEFNISRRGRKRGNLLQGRSVLGPVHETKVAANSSSSDSDSGLRVRLGSDGLLRCLDTSAAKMNMRPSIVMTSLHSHEQDVVISVVKKLGGFVLSETVNETTTHVVCGAPRRTLNILQCLARGIWLLNKEWVIKSLEANHWIPEAEFECWSLFPGCKISRIERQEFMKQGGVMYRQDLFSGIGPIYVSGRSVPPRPQVVQLIKLCGGQVTGQLNKTRVYVGSDFHPGLICVKTTWALDSIMAHRILPMDRYMLDRPKRESSPVY